MDSRTAYSSGVLSAEADTLDVPEQPAQTPALSLVEAQGAARASLEIFIARRFDEVYQARVHRFLPRLFGLHGASGERVAAFGLRAAGESRLFLEHYLDEPVERVVFREFACSAQRSEIAEVGNLAGASPGALRDLIPELTRFLHREGFRWIAFTGAARLCNGFSRLGLPLQVIAPARLDHLPESERAHWGSYYALEPSVMLGDIAAGHSILNAKSGKPGSLARQLAPVAGVGAP